MPTMRWDGYARVAFDETRQVGAASPQVSRRLQSALQDLLTVAPPERRAALQRQLVLLSDLAGSAASSEADRQAAVVPDPAGIGSAADLVTAPPS